MKRSAAYDGGLNLRRRGIGRLLDREVVRRDIQRADGDGPRVAGRRMFSRDTGDIEINRCRLSKASGGRDGDTKQESGHRNLRESHWRPPGTLGRQSTEDCAVRPKHDLRSMPPIMRSPSKMYYQPRR